jgi:hypothetical protein|tara:strand:- start:567 stop:848 length:282 start_codon:yes stop_codon:yes gene_type:complete
MKESISFKESQAIIGGTDERAKRQELDRLRELNCRSVCVRENAEQRQETEELRDLCESQARIIEAMQKQLDIAHRVEFAKRRAPRDASRDFSG